MNTRKKATTATKKITSTKSKKQNVKKINKNYNIFEKLLARKSISTLAVVAIFSLVGSLLIFQSKAATSNFEAESAKEISKEITVGSDSSASGGKYVTFSKSGPIIPQNAQRFPGDPNPRVTGKAYWGAGVGGNSDPKPRHENSAGKSLAIRRTFFGWNHIDSGYIVNTARTDHQNNRLPFVSFKTPKWKEFAAGDSRHNAKLDKLLRELDALGKPVWLTAYHEPEDNTNTGTGREKCEKQNDCGGTVAEWRDLQKRVRERMNALGTKNIAFMPVLMDWTFDKNSHRNGDDWWVDGIWDAYFVDPYQEKPGKNISDNTGMKNFMNWIEKKGLPFGTAEWGIRTTDKGSFIDQADTIYANDNNKYCSAVHEGQFLKKTTEQEEDVAKSKMQDQWEYGFANNKDWLAHTYFDSCLNSTSGAWSLGKSQLERFQEILRDDTRIMRLDELMTNISVPKNYGTVVESVSVPAVGEYKVWARMSVPSLNSRNIEIQIDNGNVMRIGDNISEANKWVWESINDPVRFRTTTPKISIAGKSQNIKLDRILLTNENCIPFDKGDNCTNPVVIQPPSPSIGFEPVINGISPNQTVSGKIKVNVTSVNNDIIQVTFRPGGKWQFTSEQAPFEWEWDTTKYPDGPMKFFVRATKSGDPKSKFTERSVEVNIRNKIDSPPTTGNPTTPQNPTPPPPTPPQPPKDTKAPTAPTSLRASRDFNWSRFSYDLNLSWLASTDDNEVTGYKVSRNNKEIGRSSDTRFTDSDNLKSGQTYNYQVQAYDAAGNMSVPASLSLKINCGFLTCSVKAL